MRNRAKTASPQQIALIQWTARLGAVTAEALALRESCSVGSARQRLLAADRAGLLARERPLAASPAVFTATRAGLRVADLTGIEPARVSAANARHSIECATAAVALERLYPEYRAIGERALRREEHVQAKPLASASLGTGADGSRLLHRPDIVLWPEASTTALPVAVEVELTVKAPRRLTAICRAWARCRCVAGVLYLVSPEVRGPLERAVAAAGAERAIAAIALEVLNGAAS
ncbi:MAG: hypothetical protein ACYDHN_04060 [Solirubrobacteraceae bacterium]